MVFEFQPIEKTFKKKCSKCGRYKVGVKGNFGHSLCNKCARLKHISKVNSITIPSFLIKKYGLRNVPLYLDDHKEGILVRKAREGDIQ